MRVRIYVDGRPDWSTNVPSYARLPGHGGALVVAPSKPVRTPLTANQTSPPPPKARRHPPKVERIGQGKHPGYATEQERLNARRQTWRESKQRAAQRDHRAKMRAEVAAMRAGRVA